MPAFCLSVRKAALYGGSPTMSPQYAGVFTVSDDTAQHTSSLRMRGSRSSVSGQFLPCESEWQARNGPFGHAVMPHERGVFASQRTGRMVGILLRRSGYGGQGWNLLRKVKGLNELRLLIAEWGRQTAECSVGQEAVCDRRDGGGPRGQADNRQLRVMA